MELETTSQPVRILLVEDNDGDIWLISKALEEAAFPHKLTVVKDGAEAMRLLRCASTETHLLPQLLVLDLNLPRVDGTSIIDLLRSQTALQSIPVVLTSSSQAPHDLAKAHELRYAIFVTKPCALDAFMAIGPQIKAFWERWPGPLDPEQMASSAATIK